jgi:hypothetical protein
VLEFDRLDRDAIMPVAPIDLLFSRATAAHVVSLHVAGRAVLDDGRLTGVDLDDAHEKLREHYRDRIATRAVPGGVGPARARGGGVLSRTVRVLLRRGLAPRSGSNRSGRKLGAIDGRKTDAGSHF